MWSCGIFAVVDFSQFMGFGLKVRVVRSLRSTLRFGVAIAKSQSRWMPRREGASDTRLKPQSIPEISFLNTS